MFATEKFTLDRLTHVCEMVGFTLTELTQEAAASAQKIRSLTPEQEAILVSDMKLLLTAVCALNHWSISSIVNAYQMTEAECLQRLLTLDRLRMIELLPGNRIRLIIARDFDWLSEGPIRKFFHDQGQDDFLSGSFKESGESLAFVHGMLTDAAFSQLQPELLRLRNRFAELHDDSLSSPVSQKRSASLLLASRRDWEPMAFSNLRRHTGT